MECYVKNEKDELTSILQQNALSACRFLKFFVSRGGVNAVTVFLLLNKMAQFGLLKTHLLNFQVITWKLRRCVFANCLENGYIIKQISIPSPTLNRCVML